MTSNCPQSSDPPVKKHLCGLFRSPGPAKMAFPLLRPANRGLLIFSARYSSLVFFFLKKKCHSHFLTTLVIDRFILYLWPSTARH